MQTGWIVPPRAAQARVSDAVGCRSVGSGGASGDVAADGADEAEGDESTGAAVGADGSGGSMRESTEPAGGPSAGAARRPALSSTGAGAFCPEAQPARMTIATAPLARIGVGCLFSYAIPMRRLASSTYRFASARSTPVASL